MQHHLYQSTPSFLINSFGTFNYTRQEALEQGILMDVTAQAKRFNFSGAVAISQMLFDQCVKWDRFDTECQIYQNQDSRLSSLLTVARAAIRISGVAATETRFVLTVIPKDGYSLKKTPKRLRTVLDKGDQNQPVLTIMMADDPHQALLDFTRTAQENLNERNYD